MILMEIFSYVIDALLIYVFYDKYFPRQGAENLLLWRLFGALLR